MVTLESCRDRSDTHPHPASPVEGEGKGRKLGTISSWKIGYSSPSSGGRESEGGEKRRKEAERGGQTLRSVPTGPRVYGISY